MNKVPQNKINWGRNLWNILHFITTRYDTSLRKDYEVFYKNSTNYTYLQEMF